MNVLFYKTQKNCALYRYLPGVLLEVLQPADVFLFEFTGPIGSVHWIRLTFDGLRNKFIQRLFETLQPILPAFIEKKIRKTMTSTEWTLLIESKLK